MADYIREAEPCIARLRLLSVCVSKKDVSQSNTRHTQLDYYYCSGNINYVSKLTLFKDSFKTQHHLNNPKQSFLLREKTQSDLNPKHINTIPQ